MKRSFALAAAFVFFVLALLLSSPLASRTVRADDLKKDKCDACLQKLAADQEKCAAKYGEFSQTCADEFNQAIINCYATVCEQ